MFEKKIFLYFHRILWRSYLPWFSLLFLIGLSLLPLFLIESENSAENRALLTVQLLAYGMILLSSLVIPTMASHSLEHLKVSGLYELFYSHRPRPISILISTLLPVALFQSVALLFFIFLLTWKGAIPSALLLDQILSHAWGAIHLLSIVTLLSLIFTPFLTTLVIALLSLLLVTSGGIIEHWTLTQNIFIQLLWRLTPRFDLFHPLIELFDQGNPLTLFQLLALALRTSGTTLIALSLFHFRFKPSFK